MELSRNGSVPCIRSSEPVGLILQSTPLRQESMQELDVPITLWPTGLGRPPVSVNENVRNRR